MAETFKELADAQLATKPTALYTVPGATVGKVKTIEAINLTGSDQTINLYAGTGPIAISTRARDGSNVATIVTGSAHGLTSGDYVDVVGVGGTGYNATRVQVTVTNSTTFTYANTGSLETTQSDTGGVVINRASRYWTAVVRADDKIEHSPTMPIFLAAAEILSGYCATASAVRVIATGSEVA